ncbi:MAG TPA: polyprenyl synthetase family protein [Bacteroidia bacterium]|jgi:geranylgeranyl diphosphate synthase type II|nr:polyprenyl synthetase family protein [Bacteroidia bacterium]
MRTAEFISLIEQECRTICETLPASPPNLYDPIRYALAPGGKRLRPLMTLLAADLFSENVSHAFPSAMAIELFHNFSLLHDDIMDNAPLRRGNPSVHVKWNANVAILSGDALYTESFRQLGRSDKNVLPQLLSIFTRTALQVCEGQQLDMDFETQQHVSIADYLRMIELKTAVLIGAALQMGAISAGATLKDSDLLYIAGKHLGVAFQLQDDVLDVYGAAEKFGKRTGGDIVANKKTFLLLKAFELANRYQKEELQNWSQTNASSSLNADEKVNGVKAIYDSLNVKDHALKEMHEHYRHAIAALEKVNAPAEKKKSLLHFADGLMKREH